MSFHYLLLLLDHSVSGLDENIAKIRKGLARRSRSIKEDTIGPARAMKAKITDKLKIYHHEIELMQTEIKARSNFIQENVKEMEKGALEHISRMKTRDVNLINEILGEIEAKCQYAYDFLRSVKAINDISDEDVLELYTKMQAQEGNTKLPNIRDIELPEAPSKSSMPASARDMDGIIEAIDKISSM